MVDSFRGYFAMINTNKLLILWKFLKIVVFYECGNS